MLAQQAERTSGDSSRCAANTAVSRSDLDRQPLSPQEAQRREVAVQSSEDQSHDRQYHHEATIERKKAHLQQREGQEEPEEQSGDRSGYRSSASAS
jgi:hypothetical protein